MANKELCNTINIIAEVKLMLDDNMQGNRNDRDHFSRQLNRCSYTLILLSVFHA